MTNYQERLKLPILKTSIDQLDFSINLYTEHELCVANSYERIVIGGRGPYIEFSQSDLYIENFYIPDLQKYRVNSNVVYYIEYRTIIDNVKIYRQTKSVDYADYIPGLWYISPFDLYYKNNGNLIRIIDPIKKSKSTNI